MNLAAEFLSSVIKRFKEYKALGDRTFAQLGEEDLHHRPNETTNSIAIIVQHLHGNMLSRWTNFLTEDGEKTWRQRDSEFEVRLLTKEQVLALWNEGWNVFLQALASLNENDLLKTVTIRSQPLIVIDAINRQMAHYCLHVGQIIYLGKWLRNKEWESLSIPKGASAAFNQEMEKSQQQ